MKKISREEITQKKMAGTKGEEMLYKRESKMGVTTFTFQSRRYMFPSVIVKGDPNTSEGDCVMLDVGLFCPHCSRAVSGKLSSTLRRVALTKSTSAENINQARVYGAPGNVPQALPYGSLDRASLKSRRHGMLEERGVAFSVGHGSVPEIALSEEHLCRHGAIPRPIPCLPTHQEREPVEGEVDEDITQPVSTRNTTETPQARTTRMSPVYASGTGDANSMERRSDYDSLDYSSVTQSLDTSIRSVREPYRKNSSSDYESMDTSVTHTTHQHENSKSGIHFKGSDKQRNTKHQSLETLGKSPASRPGPSKRHSDDATIFADNRPKISRISPDSDTTGSSLSTIRQAGLIPSRFRDSKGEVYISDSEQIDMADSSEEALIEELLHDEEITDNDSVGRDILDGLSSGDELENYEQEIDKMQKVISASLEKVAKQSSEDFQFDEYLAYVPQKARPKSQESVDLYTKEVTAILEGMGGENDANDDSDERKRSISPDEMVETILDNLDTELYSGDVTLNRIFSVRRDFDGSVFKETPRRPKYKAKKRPIITEDIDEEALFANTQPTELKELRMTQTVETSTVSTQEMEPKYENITKDSEVDYISKLDITQASVFAQSPTNGTASAKEREWSPEDFFEQAVESIPIDSEEGLTDWTSDYETDNNEQFDRDKIKTDFNIKSESDQDESRPEVVSGYPQEYLGVRHNQSRTSSCEAILNDCGHETESSLGASYHDTGSEHSGSMDYLSSSECSVGENNISAIEHDADFRQIISETMNMTESLKSFQDRKEKPHSAGKKQSPSNSEQKDAILVHSEDEEHLRQEIRMHLIEQRLEGGERTILHVPLEKEYHSHNTSETPTTRNTNPAQQEVFSSSSRQEAVCPARSPLVQKPPMFARINKIPLVSNAAEDVPEEQCNRSASSSEPDASYDDVDLDLELEFENNMRLCEQDSSSMGLLESESDDIILQELLSVDMSAARTRKESSGSHQSEIDEFVPETDEDQPEVIQQAYEAAQFVAKLLEGEQLHHPCVYTEDDPNIKHGLLKTEDEERSSDRKDQHICHSEDANWHTYVGDPQGADSDFETRGSLSRQQAQEFMRIMMASNQSKRENNKPQKDKAEESKACAVKADEGIIVKSEEITTQECTIVLMWPKKKNKNIIKKDNNPFREVHLHRVTKVNDLDIEVIEGPTIDSVEYNVSEQAVDKRQNMDRISKEMSLVKSVVAKEIPMVYKTDSNDGRHSVRSAQKAEQSTIETPTGNVISVNRSDKFTHILTTYDTVGSEPDISPEASEVHDLKADDEDVVQSTPALEKENERQGEWPLSSKAAISSEEGELTESVSMVSSVACCSVEDQIDGASNPEQDIGESNLTSENVFEESNDVEVDDLSDTALYSIVRDLKALINSQSDEVDPFEGYTPKGQAIPTTTVDTNTARQSVTTVSQTAIDVLPLDEERMKEDKEETPVLEVDSSASGFTTVDHTSNVKETGAPSDSIDAVHMDSAVECYDNIVNAGRARDVQGPNVLQDIKNSHNRSTHTSEAAYMLFDANAKKGAQTIPDVSMDNVPNPTYADETRLAIHQPLEQIVGHCNNESSTVNSIESIALKEVQTSEVSNPETSFEHNVVTDSVTDNIRKYPMPEISKINLITGYNEEFHPSQTNESDVAIYSDDYEYSSMEAMVEEYETTESEDETVEETVASVLYDVVTTIVEFQKHTQETSASLCEDNNISCEQNDDSRREETVTKDTNALVRENVAPVIPSNKNLSDTCPNPQTGYLPDGQDLAGVELRSVSEQVELLVERTKRCKFREPDPSHRFGSPLPKDGSSRKYSVDEQQQSDISAEETKVMGSENEMTQLTKEIREKIKCLLSSELEIDDEYSMKKVELVDAATETLSRRDSSSPSRKETKTTEVEADRAFLMGLTRDSSPRGITRLDEIRIDTTLRPDVKETDPFLSPVYVPGVKDHSAFIEKQLQSPTSDMFSEEYDNDISQLERVEWSEIDASNPAVDDVTSGIDEQQRSDWVVKVSSSAPAKNQNTIYQTNSNHVGLSSTIATTTTETSKTVFSSRRVETHLPVDMAPIGSYKTHSGGFQSGTSESSRAGTVSPNTQERSIYEVDVRKYFGLPNSQPSPPNYSINNRSKSHEEIRNNINEQYLTSSQERLSVDTGPLVSCHSTSSLSTRSKHLRLPKIRDLLIEELSKDDVEESRFKSEDFTDDVLLGWLVNDKCLSLEEEIMKRLKELLQLADKFYREGTIPKKDKCAAYERLASKSQPNLIDLDMWSLEHKVESLAVNKLMNESSSSERSSKSLSPEMKHYVNNMAQSIMQKVMASVKTTLEEETSRKHEDESCAERESEQHMMGAPGSQEITEELAKKEPNKSFSDTHTVEKSIERTSLFIQIESSEDLTKECSLPPLPSPPPPLNPKQIKPVNKTAEAKTKLDVSLEAQAKAGGLKQDIGKETEAERDLTIESNQALEYSNNCIDIEQANNVETGDSDSPDEGEVTLDLQEEIETFSLFTKMELKENYAPPALETIEECDEDHLSSEATSAQSSIKGSKDDIPSALRENSFRYEVHNRSITESLVEEAEDENSLMAVEKLNYREFDKITFGKTQTFKNNCNERDDIIVVSEMGGSGSTPNIFEQCEILSDIPITTHIASKSTLSPHDGQDIRPAIGAVAVASLMEESQKESIMTAKIFESQPHCISSIQQTVENVHEGVTPEHSNIKGQTVHDEHPGDRSSSEEPPTFFVSLAVLTLMDDMLDKLEENEMKSEEDFPCEIVSLNDTSVTSSERIGDTTVTSEEGEDVLNIGITSIINEILEAAVAYSEAHKDDSSLKSGISDIAKIEVNSFGLPISRVERVKNADDAENALDVERIKIEKLAADIVARVVHDSIYVVSMNSNEQLDKPQSANDCASANISTSGSVMEVSEIMVPINIVITDDSGNTHIHEHYASPVLNSRNSQSSDSLSKEKYGIQCNSKSRSCEDMQYEDEQFISLRDRCKNIELQSNVSIQSHDSGTGSQKECCDMKSGSETDSTLRASESDLSACGLYFDSSSTLKASDSDLSGYGGKQGALQSQETIEALSQEDIAAYSTLNYVGSYPHEEKYEPQGYLEDSSESDSETSSSSSSSSSNTDSNDEQMLVRQCNNTFREKCDGKIQLESVRSEQQPFWDSVFGVSGARASQSSSNADNSDDDPADLVLSNPALVALSRLPDDMESVSTSTHEESMSPGKSDEEKEERGRESLSYEEILPHILSQESEHLQGEISTMYFAPIRDDRSDDSDIGAHVKPVIKAEGEHIEARYEALPYLKETALLDDSTEEEETVETKHKGKFRNKDPLLLGAGSSSESDSDIEQLKSFLQSYSCHIEPSGCRPRSCPPISLSPNFCLPYSPQPDPGMAREQLDLDSLVHGQSAVHDKLSRVTYAFDKLLDEIKCVKDQFEAIQSKKTKRRWSANLEELYLLKNRTLELQGDVQHVSRQLDFKLNRVKPFGGSSEDFTSTYQHTDGSVPRSRSSSGGRRVQFLGEDQVQKFPSECMGLSQIGGNNSAFRAFTRTDRGELDSFSYGSRSEERIVRLNSKDSNGCHPPGRHHYSDQDLRLSDLRRFYHGERPHQLSSQQQTRGSRTSRTRLRTNKDGDTWGEELSDDEGHKNGAEDKPRP